MLCVLFVKFMNNKEKYLHMVIDTLPKNIFEARIKIKIMNDKEKLLYYIVETEARCCRAVIRYLSK